MENVKGNIEVTVCGDENEIDSDVKGEKWKENIKVTVNSDKN